MADIDIDALPPPPGAQASAGAEVSRAIDVDSLPPPPKDLNSQAIDVDSLPPPSQSSQILQIKPNNPYSGDAQTEAFGPAPANQGPSFSESFNKNLQNVGSALAAPIEKGLQLLQTPASAIGHIVARYTDPELLHYAQLKQQQDGAISGFLEAPVLVGDALEKHIESTAFKTANAISPKGDWETNSPGFRQALASFVGGMTPFMSHVAAMGINVVTDPLMWLGAASKVGGVATEASSASEASEGLPVVKPNGEFTYTPTPEEVLTNVDPAQLVKKSLGQEVSSGDRAILQAMVPGTTKPVLTIRGQAVANLFDRVKADFWTSKLGQTTAGSFSSSSEFSGADALLQAHNIETQGVSYLTEKAASELTPLDENIVRHATLQGEFPNAYGEVSGRLKLPGLDPDEAQASLERQAQWRNLDLRAKVQMEKVGGHIAEFKPASVTDQAQAIQDMLKKGQINEPQAELFSKIGFSQDRGFGRAMTDEAAQAFEDITRSGKSFGDSSALKDKSASMLERSKLSTPAQNILWGERLGLSEPFDPNTDRVVLRNYAQNLQTASDIKLIKGVIQGYGRSLDGWAEIVSGANKEVNLAKELGVPVHQETLMFHGLDPEAALKHERFISTNPLEGLEINQASTGLDTSKLVKMPDQIWERVKNNYNLTDEKNLYFPKSVVEAVSSRFNRPGPATVTTIYDKLNMAWAKNALTSVSRISLDALTSAGVYFNERGDWSKIFKVASELVSPSAERSDLGIIFDHSPMKANYYDAMDVRREIPLNTEILSNPEAHAPVADFFQSMQKVVKNEGSLDPLIKQWSLRTAAGGVMKGADKSLDLLNAFNDLAPFKWIRERGPALTNVFKEAYFRTLVEERGVNPQVAMQEVNRAFLDFSTPTPNATKMLQRVWPFANFMIKNMGRVAPLLLDRPGAVNVLNPYNGYLKKAIEDYSGYSPEQVQVLNQTVGPFPHDPVLGTVLHGADDVINQKDLVKKFINQYVMALAPKGSQDALKEGYRLIFRLPTHLGAAAEMGQMLNPFQAMERGDLSFGPLVKAGIAVTLGLDPYTGQKLKYDSDPNNAKVDRVMAALGEVNPLNFSKLTNGMVKPLLDELVPQWRANLENYGLPAKTAKMLLSVLSDGRDNNVQKVDDSVLKTLTNYKFFGLGYLTQADQSYQMFQLSQYRAINEILRNATKEKDPAIRKRELESLNKTISDMNFNAKVYQDYNARSVRNSDLHTPDPKINFDIGGQQ